MTKNINFLKSPVPLTSHSSQMQREFDAGNFRPLNPMKPPTREIPPPRPRRNNKDMGKDASSLLQKKSEKNQKKKKKSVLLKLSGFVQDLVNWKRVQLTERQGKRQGFLPTALYACRKEGRFPIILVTVIVVVVLIVCICCCFMGSKALPKRIMFSAGGKAPSISVETPSGLSEKPMNTIQKMMTAKGSRKWNTRSPLLPIIHEP